MSPHGLSWFAKDKWMVKLFFCCCFCAKYRQNGRKAIPPQYNDFPSAHHLPHCFIFQWFRFPEEAYNDTVYNLLSKMSGLQQLDLSQNPQLSLKELITTDDDDDDDDHHHPLNQLLLLPSLSQLTSLKMVWRMKSCKSPHHESGLSKWPHPTI